MPITLTITLTIAVMLSILLAVAAWLDATRYVIPNWLNGLLLVLFPVAYFLVPGLAEQVDWLERIGVFFGIFALGYIFFLMNWMGGGDVKMLCVLALWCGFNSGLLHFQVMSAIFGGLLTLVLLFGRFGAANLASRVGWERLPRVFSYGEPLPYGIAIAAGFLWTLWGGNVRGFESLWEYTKPLGRALQHVFGA